MDDNFTLHILLSFHTVTVMFMFYSAVCMPKRLLQCDQFFTLQCPCILFATSSMSLSSHQTYLIILIQARYHHNKSISIELDRLSDRISYVPHSQRMKYTITCLCSKLIGEFMYFRVLKSSMDC